MNTSEVKEREPVALIDLDGTLADYDSAMVGRLAELQSPDEPPIEANWGSGPPWLEARRDLIKSQPGFWRNLPKIIDGFAVLDIINEVGFETHILTKGPFRTTSAWTEKVEWVRTMLPHVPVTISEDKGLVYGRLLFDDFPPYVERWLEWRPRGLVIMLDQPWNQGFEHPNVFRFFQYRKTEAEILKREIATSVRVRRTPEYDRRLRTRVDQDNALRMRLREVKDR